MRLNNPGHEVIKNSYGKFACFRAFVSDCALNPVDAPSRPLEVENPVDAPRRPLQVEIVFVTRYTVETLQSGTVITPYSLE